MPVTMRMVLRRTNWPDIDDVVALNADREVMRYVGDGLPMTGARVLAEEMPRLMAHMRRADQLGCYTAHDRATGAFLGWFSVTPVDQSPATVEVSYRLGSRAWAQGYAIEGMLLMIEMARVAQASTVIATIMAVDDASRGVMEAAGLTVVPAWIGGWTVPITETERGAVSYALDLTATALSPTSLGSSAAS